MTSQKYLSNTQHSVSWFQKAFGDGELELNPPFQRNPVWTERQKSFLIDTILHGYPVPELYMQEFVDAVGTSHHVVVDGQQRIRACLEFLENRFTLSEVEDDSWRDLTFDELSPEEKKQIYGYNFVVRTLPEMPEPELRDMFARLNRFVVALNAQELRHATYWGPFIRLMEEIADLEYWSEFDVFSANDIRRMLDVEYISELAVALLHGPQDKKKNLDKWYAAYEEEFEGGELLRDAFARVAGELSMILPNLRATRWRRKSDFYSLFLLFAENQRRLPLSSDQRQICGEILLRFGEAVTDALREPEVLEAGEIQDQNVLKYALSVGRAASDLGNRRRRAAVLRSVLSACFG